MAVKTTQDKFMHEIGDIYDAENQFLKGMEQMVEKTSDKTLQSMISEHIQQTQGQIRNLEQVYNLMGQQPQRVRCDAAAGLVAEARKNMEESDGAIRDCMIDGAASKVEHYEIASYRGLITSAQGMGQQQVVSLLQQNLQQEEQTAQKLEQSAPQLLSKAKSQEGK